MLKAIATTQNVLQLCTHVLLNGVGAEIPQHDAVFYNVDDIRHSYDSLSQHFTITIGPELNTKKVVIFNSLTFNRVEVVKFFVSTPFVQVCYKISKYLQRNYTVDDYFRYWTSIIQ